MINNNLIKKFCNIKEQLESCFKEFINQVIKNNGYSEKIKKYFIEVLVVDSEISVCVTFENNFGQVALTFCVDSENPEDSFKEQIENYLNDIMRDEDYD